jgi:hypothetical protein
MTVLPSVPGNTRAPTMSGHRLASHSRPAAARRSREKALALFVLAVAFAITVTLLTIQWLSSENQATSAPSLLPSITVQVNWA